MFICCWLLQLELNCPSNIECCLLIIYQIWVKLFLNKYMQLICEHPFHGWWFTTVIHTAACYPAEWLLLLTLLSDDCCMTWFNSTDSPLWEKDAAYLSACTQVLSAADVMGPKCTVFQSNDMWGHLAPPWMFLPSIDYCPGRRHLVLQVVWAYLIIHVL
jgi:hypothetical protein